MHFVILLTRRDDILLLPPSNVSTEKVNLKKKKGLSDFPRQLCAVILGKCYKQEPDVPR